MSRQESEPSSKPRQRANTTFAAPFASWRRGRQEQSAQPLTTPATQQQPSLSLEDLIAALTPPAEPSLYYARSLASLLSTFSPLPKREVLNPVLVALCNAKHPTSVQAAGYDILSAYLENHEAVSLSTSERLSCLSLFLGASTSWGMELWEPRFKALRSLTKYGMEITGIEDNVIELLKSWIEGAFNGLLQPPSHLDRSERAERERSVDVLVKFFNDILQKTENISRITVEGMGKVLQFYATLIDRSIASDVAAAPTSTVTPASVASKPAFGSHRRNLSSLSSSSVPSVSSLQQPIPQGPNPTPFKHPAEIAIDLYLDDLSSHIKVLPPIHLRLILPLLFRALSFCATPLSRLAIHQPRRKHTLEDKLTETLNALFAGPYATLCMRVLKYYLFPPGSAPLGLRNSLFSSEATAIASSLEQMSHPPVAIMTAFGAHRTLRNYVRCALSARLARAYISRETSTSYTHSGAPGRIELESDLMERAWPKDDYTAASVGFGGNGWDAGRLGKVLAESVGAWIDFHFDSSHLKSDPEVRSIYEKEREGKEEILEEAAGILKDILQELDLREDENGVMDEEEANVVGLTLWNLVGYVFALKNLDGTPFIIPLCHPNDAPTPILRTISSLLARDHARALNPLLSSILIRVAEHLTDADTSRLPILMMEQHDLSPTSPDWLKNWANLLEDDVILDTDRVQTRRAIIDTLQQVYESVKDMTSYRRPLGDLALKFCSRPGRCEDADVMWKLVGEEVVLRKSEQEEGDPEAMADLAKFVDLLISVANESPEDEADNFDGSSIHTADTQPPSASVSGGPSTLTSPTLSRIQSDSNTITRDNKEKDSNIPSVMSIFNSLTTGGSQLRSQSVQPHPQEESKTDIEDISPQPGFDPPPVPREVSAVSALVEIFSQFVFTPLSLEPKNLRLAIRVYEMLLAVLSKSRSVRAKLTVLQFLMRMRVDRDHRLYFVSGDRYDPNGMTYTLGCLINRNLDTSSQDRPSDDSPPEGLELRKARARFPQERDGRRLSRGRGTIDSSHSGPSRSRSRTMAPLPPPPPPPPLEPLWHIPESLPFCVSGSDSPSEVLVSYDPEGPDRIPVLPLSRYLLTIIDLVEKETSWEVLSYILCHLPVQLSNKHLFCGPNCRNAISRMLSVLCAGLLNGDLASNVEQFSLGLKVRDAHGLAYQTLSVLVSYRRCFKMQQQHHLVEVFQAGLNGQLSTIKCCLHALSLSAFELPNSMMKYLSHILEKLSQIMSNPNMAVHILNFLSIIGSLPDLHANFTEAQFKMVFGVALQYLQHYNRQHASPTMSWALSQNVRILSYSAVYVWFLALQLPDRPRHIQYITRQLLLANEGNSVVDEPTEVCFDWLARYTYASADSRPANSLFSDIVLSSSSPSENPVKEKTWIMGNSIVTIRALTRSGWVEVLSRRPSGYSRFVCRVENLPMVGPGDVAPDLLSATAGLIMERDPARVSSTVEGELIAPADTEDESSDLSVVNEAGDKDPDPDPITGYVWSGTAPSQRRKQVAIDPSYLILQLSPIPDGSIEPYVKKVVDPSTLPKFLNSLDRIPVIDTHKVGIMYVAPGQSHETEILWNTHGSPAYTRFLEGIGRLINLRGQVDVYAGGLDPDEDGEYAYAWWDDIGQILYHTATMMPSHSHDPRSNGKKKHIGNDYVRIVWNDSGLPYRFETLSTQFQFVNIVIEPHSVGSIAAFSNNLHEREYFKVTVQTAPGMTEFAPVGHFKIISAENLPLLVRRLSLLADWYAAVFRHTKYDTVRVEMKTNWHLRLESIRRFKNQLPSELAIADPVDGVMGQEGLRDFTTSF